MITPFPSEELIFGKSPAMWEVQQKVIRAAEAKTGAPVLIQGESGTGKEILARLIHRRSPWNSHRFVKVHCPAIPADLLESELFGYEEGAFTGASRSKPGRFEEANGGTLLLDEIAELGPRLQAKLLHVLQDGEVSRIGGQEQLSVKVRILCSTNRNLEQEIAAGRFRQDLYYRINVLNIELPPLKERLVDLPLLAAHFLTVFNDEYHRQTLPLSEGCMDILLAYHWPGNIRELSNLLNRYVILGSESLLIKELLAKNTSYGGADPAQPPQSVVSLKKIAKLAGLEAQKKVILSMLQSKNWNRKEAARALNISYRALLYKLKDAGITRKRKMQLKHLPSMQHVN